MLACRVQVRTLKFARFRALLGPSYAQGQWLFAPALAESQVLVSLGLGTHEPRLLADCIHTYPFSACFVSQACCDLAEAPQAYSDAATVDVLRNPAAGRDSILTGKYRIGLEGLERPVKVQNVPNIKIGVVQGDARVGQVGIYLVYR